MYYLHHWKNNRRKTVPLKSGEHLEKFAKILRKSERFNPDWYINQYPSVVAEVGDVALEYLLKGYLERGNSEQAFDSHFYLTEYPDVANSRQNPLVHYILYGKDEGRLPKAGRAFILEQKLWGGFSRYALVELELLKSDSNAGEPEKIWASWSLLVWHYTHSEYTQAIENFVFACQLRESLKHCKKWVINAAWCEVRLRNSKSARELLDNTIKKGGFNPNCSLAMSNTIPTHAALAGSPDTDAFRLHWINSVFENSGLTSIQKRDHARSLTLSNIKATIHSQSAVSGLGKISIVMPAYNASSTIALAVESIIGQTWNDFELNVVDDCSTDDTFAIVQRYAEKDPRVTVMRQPRNLGAYAARNAGVKISNGDFITVHDCDDWSHPQKFEAQLTPLLENSQLFGSFSFWVKVDWHMNIVGGWRPWGNLIEFNESSFLFRRSLLDSIGEWDEVRVTGDREFIWRAEAKHGEGAFVHVCKDAPLSFSLASQNSLTQSPNTHVKTVFYGLRRIYRESAQWWHRKNKDKLYLDNNVSGRPFPAPFAILNSPPRKPISYVIVSDFSQGALTSNNQPIEALEMFSCLGPTALFHWPNYSLDEDTPIDGRVFEIAAENSVRLLAPGETVDAEAVVITRPEPLEWLLDSIPTVKCQSVFIISDKTSEDESDAPLKDTIRLNIESVFGHSPVCLPLSIAQDYFEISKCVLFSKYWYLNHYQDVADAGRDPLSHYLTYGANEGRDPGPEFSTSGYLARYQDVATAGINPLLHYIRYGRKEGRLITPCVNPRLIKRPYRNFGDYLTHSLLDPLVKAPFSEIEKNSIKFMDQVSKWLCLKAEEFNASPLVSVIMPVRDRAALVGNAVGSVLKQTYPNFELVIVDDGSWDDSVSVVKSFSDPRIHFIETSDPAGVSAARNRGLEAARGDLIAYLDSDNTWRPEYLKSMIGFFHIQPDADAAYSGQYIYRGFESEPFAVRFGCYNPSLLRNRNFIDLNCFIHRRNILDSIGGGFCEDLKRWVDWELILRISRACKVYSVPILQSNYFLDKAEKTITATEEMQPARDFILAKLGYGGQSGLQRNEDQLKRRVAVIVTGQGGQGNLTTIIELLEDQSCHPLVQVFVVADPLGVDAASYLRNQESTRIQIIVADSSCDFFHSINQTLRATDPDTDILILDPTAILTSGTLSALQKAAYTGDSIAIATPQQVLPAGEPSINSHVPYAFNDVPCDVALSSHYRNVETVPLFHSGGMIDLNFASLFCLYIKREIWDECSILGNEKGEDGQTDRIMCDFVRHVLGKRIVYTPEAVVLQRNKTHGS